ADNQPDQSASGGPDVAVVGQVRGAGQLREVTMRQPTSQNAKDPPRQCLTLAMEVRGWFSGCSPGEFVTAEDSVDRENEEPANKHTEQGANRDPDSAVPRKGYHAGYFWQVSVGQPPTQSGKDRHRERSTSEWPVSANGLPVSPVAWLLAAENKQGSGGSH